MSNQVTTAIRSLTLGVLSALAIAGAACAQASSTQATTSTGTILVPIVLTKSADLAFGSIVRPTSGSGVLTVAAGSVSRTTTAGAILTGSTFSRATYGIAGEGGQAYSITVPATMNMTRVSGTETLTVTLTSTATSGTLSGTLGTAGTGSFFVGGAFPIASTTVSGAYTGTFNAVVAYN